MNHRIVLLLLLLAGSLHASAQLTADFTSDIRQGCSPIVVNFQDRSSGGPTTWLWDFGNGATSTLQNPSATYFSIGTYTVKLTVTSNNGASTNSVTKTAYITVLEDPTVRFTADRTNGCSPAVVQFQDQSVAPGGATITNWEWDFGDAQTATGPNPTHVFRTAGSFTVTLTVTTSAGCRKLYSLPNYINVNPGVTPRFSWTDPGVCRAPATVNFTNTSNGPGTISYSWNFGDGGTSGSESPSHTFQTNGTYHVVLLASSSLGCADSMASDIIVGRVNTDVEVPQHICPRQVVTFQNASLPRPITSRWTFSNGFTDTLPNSSTSFPTPGTYTVHLVNTYATCVDSVTKTFTVSTVPQTSFTLSDSGRCQPPLNVQFTNTSSLSTSYQWIFGDNSTSTDASPSHTYTSMGSFPVTLIATDTSGCADTLTRAGLINIRKPIISYVGLPEGGCVPDTVGMKANVQTFGTVTSWLWNFGDGSAPSNLDSTGHIYNNQGTYDITLTITTSDGCTVTDTLEEGVKVGTPPVPQFVGAPTTACADPGVTFTNQSTNATDYLWNFGDGTSSTEMNPVHVFADTGHFNITLTAINNGCRQELIKPRYITILPSVSKFTYRPDCTNPLRYTFTDRSVSATGWSWDFGDNTTYNGQNPPAHTFPALGTYTVKLTTTNGGCSYTLSKQVVVSDRTPTINGIDSVGCRPFRGHVRAEGTDLGSFRKYQWNYGDGSPVDTSSGGDAFHIYTRPGTYNVTLTAIDSFGCRFTRTDTALVKVNGPVANFGAINPGGCRGMTVTFSDSSQTDGRNGIREWIWDFGDTVRHSFLAPPFTHTFDTTGDFDIKLVVIDSSGCRDSLLRRQFVRTSLLEADFTALREFCPRSNLYFPNLTRSDFPFSQVWEFGDGGTSTDYNAYHSYPDTGYYSVTLMVEDILGCRDTIRRDTFVHIKRPTASFTANNLTTYCTPFQATFQNTSDFYYQSDWSFGPGIGTSTQTHPYAFYTQPGTYPVKLVITAHGGCQDSVVQNMVVHDQSDARMDYSPLNGCTPLNVDFSAFAPMNARFVWDFGDGNVVDTTLNALRHLYTDFGDFVPRIIMRELSGQCTIALVGTRTISLLGTHAKFELDSMTFCDRGTIRPNSDSTSSNDPIVSYQWTFGDGGTASVANPVYTYTTPGTYDVQLVVNTQAGCTDTAIKSPLKIVASPQVAINADSIVCRLERVPYQGQFLVPDTSVVQWSWVFPNGNTSNQQNPPDQTYDTTGVFDVMAVAVNSTGCTDTLHQRLTVHGLPQITLPEQITKFVGVPALLNAQYSSGVTGYSWSPADNLNCATCPQPTATPSFNTLYTVTATDSNSCRNTARVQVLVLCQGARVFVPNTFSPNGDGHNDRFFVEGKGLARLKSLRIFNRWGEVVFEARDFPVNSASYGWDGMYKGQKAAPDVYVYQLEVFCENSEVLKLEGNVALIR
ncbi:MAG: PKD domain-containing protein [Chitinophagaceae bacterium]|nr:MAG: PKD domain-containing protein [Chitinophagaceae bacterium]